MTDNVFVLPDGWTEAALQDVAEINPKLDKSRFHDDLEVSFVPMPAVEAKTGSIDVGETRKFVEVKKGYTAFLERDVLFAKITPCMENGKMAVVQSLTNGIGFGSTEFHVIRPYTGLVSEYIYYFVSSQRYRFDAEHNMTGAVGQRRVPTPYVSKSRIPVPPTQAQYHIVAKIEELFSELDKGIESLKTAREQLKVYRQAVLKHAFEGKLTAQWREENKDKLETADQLLARIQKEREARYQQQLEEWKAAVKTWEADGKHGRKPSKPTKPKLATRPEISDDLFAEEWPGLELGSLAAESVLGKMLDKAKNTGCLKQYLGNINVRWGDFVLDNLKSIKIEDSEIARYCVTPGDLIICEGGEPGRCAVWENRGQQMFIQKALHRVRFTGSYNPNFAYYFLVYISLTQRIAKFFTGTTIKHLTGTGLGKISFPVCPIEEQALIVNAVEQQFSATDALDEQITDELERTEALRQSILKKAFSGQLVAQDANDEPAAVLLERIKVEKAARAKERKPTRKPKLRRKEAI